mgnify:CR=1 FL=1
MTILDLIQNEMKRVGAKDGGEYHGPCPLCGGTDRFHVWPGQGEHGTWWCRGCNKGGDAIQYLREVDGMGYKQACARLGVDAKEQDPYTVPPVKPVSTFTPAVIMAPAEKWAEKAGNFVAHCHQALLDNPVKRAWLAERGINQKTAEKYQLGWNEKDFWRERSAWGLPEELKPDGKPKKLWIPAGLVIPWQMDGSVHRLRIRRDEGEPRYYVVPGSGRSPLISRSDASAYVVVESELDAILLDAVAGDLVGCIAQGNSTARPDQSTWQPLQQALQVLVSLDTDDAGAKASIWWKQQLQNVKRWPVVGGKDPGDAFRAGIDLRVWIQAGLPPSMQLQQQNAPECTTNTAETHQVTVAQIGNHQIHITDHQPTWQGLMAEGKTAYSNHELQRLAKAVELAEEHADHAKDLILSAKEIFGGYILKTEAL